MFLLQGGAGGDGEYRRGPRAGLKIIYVFIFMYIYIYIYIYVYKERETFI